MLNCLSKTVGEPNLFNSRQETIMCTYLIKYTTSTVFFVVNFTEKIKNG